MNIDVFNKENVKVGTVEVSDRLFGAPWRPELVHDVLIAQRANERQPWAHAKGRGEVRGGGRKPWRQKGTGRARHGSIRSPLWRGGGKAHGPLSTRVYSVKVNVKTKRLALASILSKKLAENEVKIFDSLAPTEPKTARAAQMLRGLLGTAKKKNFDTLIIPGKGSKATLARVTANLQKTKVIGATTLNVYDVLNYRHLFIEQDALPVIENTYIKKPK